MGVMEDVIPVYNFFNAVRGPAGTGFDRFAPSNIYACRDGGWVLIAAPTDGPFRKLARRMGKPELLDDERFKTQSSRADHRAEIDAIVTAWTQTFDSGELVKLLKADDIPAGKSYTAADIMAELKPWLSPWNESKLVKPFIPPTNITELPCRTRPCTRARCRALRTVAATPRAVA